jgi:hypothetical protein
LGCSARQKTRLARGVVFVGASDGSPEVPIVCDNCGKGRWGRSVADETTMDGARTTVTTEQGIHR